MPDAPDAIPPPARTPGAPTRRTRLAPSPTGALHLGNARTFLVNWAMARRAGWEIVLRLEDLDGPRVKPGAIDSAIDLLRWLGIDWDAGPIVQSHDLSPYLAAMERLASRGLTYPSELTRGDIESAASAPQEGVHESAFPASLRPEFAPRAFDMPETNWRFATPDGVVRFDDAFAGPQEHAPARTVGDFVIWTKRAQPSYQLAVVVDDARQGVSDIVRGDDLLDSAARQLLLYRALGLAPEPRYAHLPLVRGSDGKRLAKRHGDTRLDAYRARGVTPERVVGLVAFWCGIFGSADDPGVCARGPRPLSTREFLAALDVTRIPREDITFSPENDAWLLQRV